MTWFDGGDKLPEDKRTYKEHLHGEKVPDSGLLLVGEKGSFFSENDYGAEHVLLPKDKFKEVEKPKPTLPRSPGHFNEWVEAIKAERSRARRCRTSTTPAGSPRPCCWASSPSRPAPAIEWDPVAMKAKNVPSADQFIRRDYRKGFSIH